MVEICKDAITQAEITELLDFFHKEDDRVLRPPWKDFTVKRANHKDPDYPRIIHKIIMRLVDYKYVFSEDIIIMESSDYNSRLHVDNSPDRDKWGNIILIPLHVPQGGAETVFFKNHYTENKVMSTTIFTRGNHPNGGAAKDINGRAVWFNDMNDLKPYADRDGEFTINSSTFRMDEKLRRKIAARTHEHFGGGYFRDAVTDYTKLTGYDPAARLDPGVVQNFLAHFPPEDLEGLTLDQVVHWKLGDAYKFQRSVLHCGSSNSSAKIGLTILLDRR